jgi:hypothetical protein
VVDCIAQEIGNWLSEAIFVPLAFEIAARLDEQRACGSMAVSSALSAAGLKSVWTRILLTRMGDSMGWPTCPP